MVLTLVHSCISWASLCYWSLSRKNYLQSTVHITFQCLFIFLQDNQLCPSLRLLRVGLLLFFFLLLLLLLRPGGLLRQGGGGGGARGLHRLQEGVRVGGGHGGAGALQVSSHKDFF